MGFTFFIFYIYFLFSIFFFYLISVKYIQEKNETEKYANEYDDLTKLEIKTFTNTSGYLF